MNTTVNNAVKLRWYSISYVLLCVPILIAYLSGYPGLVPRWTLGVAWVGAAGGGLVCALVGGGGLNKKPIDGLGSLALLLHLASAGFLMLTAFSAGAP